QVAINLLANRIDQNGHMIFFAADQIGLAFASVEFTKQHYDLLILNPFNVLNGLNHLNDLTYPWLHSSPNLARCLGNQLELASHVVPRKKIRGSGGGESELVAKGKFFRRHIFGCLLDVPQKSVWRFQLRPFGRDQTEAEGLAFRNKTQWLEPAGALGVKFHKISVHR